MGFYINPRDGRSKEQWLRDHGRRISDDIVRSFDFTTDELPVCWVDNGPFTAAGIAFNAYERDAFIHPDSRPKQWFVVRRDRLKEFMGKTRS